MSNKCNKRRKLKYESVVQARVTPREAEYYSSHPNKLMERVKARRSMFPRQWVQSKAGWHLTTQQVTSYFEDRQEKLDKEFNEVLQKISRSQAACERKLLQHEEQLDEDYKTLKQVLSVVQPLDAISVVVVDPELCQKLQPIVTRHIVPPVLNVKPTLTIFETPVVPVVAFELQTSNVYVATAREVLLSCYDDIHRVFTVDIVGILDQYTRDPVDVRPFTGKCTSEFGNNIPYDLIIQHGHHHILTVFDTIVSIWNTRSGKIFRQTNLADCIHIRQIASVGRDRLLCGSMDSVVRLFNLNSGKCIREMKGHRCVDPNQNWGISEGIRCLRMFPDMKRAVSCGCDNDIRIWDLEYGECIQILKGHTESPACCVVLGDGRRVASAGGHDKSVRIWDVKTGVCIRTLHGHMRSVVELVAVNTADGVMRLVSVTSTLQINIHSGGFDIRVWNADTGECLQILDQTGDEGAPTSLTYLGDGRNVIFKLTKGSFCVQSQSLNILDILTGKHVTLPKEYTGAGATIRDMCSMMDGTVVTIMNTSLQILI